MIFSVQHFLEDHFERRRLADVDQYAIRVANLLERLGPKASEERLARELAGVRTAFFRRNREVRRKEFEAKLAATLKARFSKKKDDTAFRLFERALSPARARFRTRRRSIQALLLEFKRAVEARGVDVFWESRTKHRLRPRPEQVAQTLLAMFAKGVLGDDGLVLKEIASGIGFVDIGVVFSGVLHLIELKVLKGQLTGEIQLAAYMRTEGRNRGWLVLIDSRRRPAAAVVPTRIKTSAGLITTLMVDVNPPVPSAASKRRRPGRG